MTDTVRYPLVLGLISLCSAAGLAFSYVMTRDEIRRQAELEKDRGLAGVFGVEFKEDDPQRPWQVLPAAPAAKGAEANYVVYAATDPKAGRALYACEGSARGYASKIDVIVAVDQTVKDKSAAARIKAVKVIAQADTPGMGDKCGDAAWQQQFEGLLLGKLELRKTPTYRQPGGEEQYIAAITGATITSNGVLSAVRQAIDRIRERAAQQPSDSPAEKP